MMKKIFGRKADTTEQLSEPDELRLIEQDVRRLAVDAEAAATKFARARVEADRCRANLGDVHPAELKNALLGEREAESEHTAAIAKHQAEASTLVQRKDEIARRRAEATAKAHRQAFDEALSAYRQQCVELIEPSLQVRRLAQEAGVFIPNWRAGELVFELHADCDLTVAGVPLPLWRAMPPT